MTHLYINIIFETDNDQTMHVRTHPHHVAVIDAYTVWL